MTPTLKPDYTTMSLQFPAVCGRDAQKWAIAFIQHMEKLEFVIDEDLMIGWFANAMAQMEPRIISEEESLHIAARVWCRPETEHIEMDVVLATAFADVLRNGEPT